VLEKNARANRKIASIDTLMAAASTQEGFVQFEYSDSGFCNGGRHEDMSILTHGHAFKLDVFCVDLQSELRDVYAEDLPKLKFIKTDTEGYDLYVLQTIGEILKEFRPIIKAEIFKKTDAAYRKNLLNFLEGLGYDVFKVDVEPIHRGERMTESNATEWDHYDIICFPSESA
jgi:FkbM family methyltransferase